MVSCILPQAGTEKAEDVLGAVLPALAAALQNIPDALAQARQAYANGDLQGAVSAYREALAKDPEYLDAVGEPGNVLYASDRMGQADPTHFDVAVKAIDHNKAEVAEALLPAVIQGNPMVASQLQHRMSELQSWQMGTQFGSQHLAQRPATAPSQSG